jgi:hypothetical protein
VFEYPSILLACRKVSVEDLNNEFLFCYFGNIRSMSKERQRPLDSMSDRTK